MDGSNWEKEKNHILQTWVIVIKCRVMLFPVIDGEFDEIAPAQSGVGDVMLLLKIVQYGDSLVLELCTEPFRKLCRRTDPFSRPNQIGDALQPAVGGAEVSIGAKCHVIKKIGASVGTDVPIFHKGADKFAVDAA